jgi:hypothetical protein
MPGSTWRTLLALLITFVGSASVLAQEPDLVLRQAGVADRYQRLEELLLRLADVEGVENPERAALLRRAAKQSREKFVLQQLRNASEALRNEKFADAVSNQDLAREGLGEILKLLTSEDRANRIRDEKKRLAEMIKDLKRIERSQRSTRARTENGSELDQLRKEQESIGDRGQKLKDQLAEENAEGEAKEGEAKEGEAKEGEAKEGEAKEGEAKEGEAKEGEAKEGEAKEGEQGKGGEQGRPGQQPPSTPQQQAEQKLQQAIEKMRQAEDELEKSKRDEAVEKQVEAEENLRQAIDELEQILRQLREEEMQRELARLESRLKKMAAMQSKLIDDTAELAATPKSQRNRQTDLKAGDLSFEQKKVTVEADRAMLLLREEGSSVAFPEVVAQIRDDSDQIAQRLSKTQIDAVTQGTQQNVLAAIEEMIQALQQAQRDLEKQKQQGESAPKQAGQPGEQPLVGAIAELKLIRTMETRIKSTTQRYEGLLQSDDTSAQDLLPLLKNLSERQARLYKITRDLVMQRNE